MMSSTVLGPQHKSFPPATWGSSTADFFAVTRGLDQFQTPLLTLDRQRLSTNVETMFGWLREAGLLLAPHGKTTMSPQLWQELIDAGAWGLTLATGWQVQVACSLGFKRIMLANTLIDPVALEWLAHRSSQDTEMQVICWVDSIEAVRAMTQILETAAARRPIPVVVELGAMGGRMGARGIDEAMRIARAVVDSPQLQLVGVGGYEGVLAHDRSPASLARVESYLDEVLELFRAVTSSGYCPGKAPILTLGGSAYFDLVASRIALLGEGVTPILRSGAFQIHDDLFYRQISPMGSTLGTRHFRSAMHVWTRIISHPEPDLLLFDAGKRDLPFDEGLPVAQRVVGLAPEESRAMLDGSVVTELNDQHGFLRISSEATHRLGSAVVGSVLRLGLSHPCTALDKWRLIPLVEDSDAEHPRIVDAVETWF